MKNPSPRASSPFADVRSMGKKRRCLGRFHVATGAYLLAIAFVILRDFIPKEIPLVAYLDPNLAIDVRDEKDVKFVLFADRQQEGYKPKLLTSRNGSSMTKYANLEVTKSAQIHSIPENTTNGLMAKVSMPRFEANGTVQVKELPANSSEVSIKVRPGIVAANSVSLPSASGKEKEIVFTHYLGHIPKSGTSYAFEALYRLLYTSPEYVNGSFRPCNEKFKNISRSWKTMRYEYKHTRCTMWMAEPESKDHKNARHKMPSTIDEWIEAWRDAKDNATKVEENQRFSCYNPIEFQSKTIEYNPELGKADLRKKWDIIGDNSQMHKSVCMIVIKYAGWVPKDCDCTGVLPPNKKALRRRFNALIYNPNIHAHGVKHHGATYVLTPEQKETISSFRKLDLELYNLVVDEIFEEQVQEIEQEYNFTLCNEITSSAVAQSKDLSVTALSQRKGVEPSVINTNSEAEIGSTKI